MREEYKYIDDKGNEIIETNDGFIFINGSCVAEPGTDADFDRYAIEIQNNDGYYDKKGKYRRY